ncbi:hypothetical protein RI129_007625 [Pyrocoelia pectoralis]|uniref:Uncharacterized protein n=1 Tax=Pyrocoelia pectoralis TaxID=417401 RepID=A0AAN7V8B6_9COLE
MKSYLVILSFVVTIWAEEKAVPVIAQQRSDAEKQEYDAVPAYYKFSPQKNAQIQEQLLNYNPQVANYAQQISLVSQQQQQQAKYASAPIPAHIMYGFAPQVQQQLEYATQPVAFAQPAPKPQHAAATRHLPTPAINFSPASEVSSFRFSSPLVTYSNQGVLQQLTGKLSAGDSVQVGQESQTIAPKKIASTQQPAVYSQAPQLAHATPQEVGAQEYNYANLPQQQQIAYVAVPQRAAYAAQQPQPKAAYASLPKQYYAVAAPQHTAAYTPQQLAYSPSDLQQFAYVLAVPQAGRSAAQPVYVAQQQAKYSNQGENYKK